MRLNISLLLASITLVSLSAQSQGIAETRAFADALFSSGKLDQALPVYQRIAFFTRPDTDPEILLSIADCFSEQGDLDKALEFYDHSYFAVTDDSLKNEVLFKKTTCFLRSKNYNFALMELLSLDQQNDTWFENKRNFFLGVTWFGLEDFVKSKDSFEKIPSDEAGREQISHIFSNRKLFYRPNPALASWLSVFIPGAGQFYTGQPLAGINSLILTGSFITLGLYLAYLTSPVDAIVTALPWFQRYYQGGFQRASDFAKIKRAENRNVAFNQILSILATE